MLCVNSLGLQGDPGGMTDLPRGHTLGGEQDSAFCPPAFPEAKSCLPEGLEPGILRGEGCKDVL